MSKRNKESFVVCKSDKVCRSCGEEMVIKKHKEITQELRNQFHYFTQWDYCRKCNKVYFNEAYRVLNSKGQDVEEYNRQLNFLRSI